MLTAFIDRANAIVWSDHLMWLTMGCGVFFTLRTRFVQLRLLPTMLRLLTGSSKSSAGISSWQSICTSLAGQIGTGNIAGTALAIYRGGPGALFWMWITALFGAASAYIECTLAQLYKVRIDGQYYGGSAFTFENGLGSRFYGSLFAVFALLACGLLLPGTQSYALASGFAGLGIDVRKAAVILTLLLLLIIFGGIRRIAALTQWLVPGMAMLYIFTTLLLFLLNIRELPEVLLTVIRSAFGEDAVYGGLMGSALRWGVKRGLYSNEAGQGNQTHAAAACEVDHPAKQGLIHALGVYIDTSLLCTATGLTLLMTDCFNVADKGGTLLHIGSGSTMQYLAANGIYGGPEFAQAALSTALPETGALLVAVCLAFFGFSSLLGYYYQAEANAVFLFRHPRRRKAAVTALRLLLAAAAYFSCTQPADLIWNIGDLGVGLMTWVNLAGIFLLQGPAIRCLKDYEQQRAAAKGTARERDRSPRFSPRRTPVPGKTIWR